MAVRVEVRGFSGAYASRNGGPADVHVGMAELVNKAITVGGLVQGSALERSRRRSAIVNVVWSSVRALGPPVPASPLAVTDLYTNTETTEKAGISFRLGMALASVVAGRVLGTKLLMHVDARSGGKGRRADLVGLDVTRQRHVVEAKARSYGLDKEVRKDAKDQATETRARLAAAGTAIATFSASLTDLSASPIFVLLEDPPARDGGEASERFDEASFVRDYFSPVPDLLETRAPERSGYERIDALAIGSWLPGTDAWLGLRREVYGRLRAGDDPLKESPTSGPDFPAWRGWLTSMTPDGHVLVLGPRALLSADEAAPEHRPAV